MSCFPCFSSKKDENENNDQEVPVAQVKDEPPVSAPPQPPVSNAEHPPVEANHDHTDNEAKMPENGNNGARTFTFRELAMATKNFRKEHLLGEGGFGKVYKGTLQTGEVVAVKRLDRNGTQGSKEFLVEVLMLTLLKHPNLVNLLGYCADGEQRLLVYEYLPLGSLKSYLHDLSEDKKPLDWKTRMKLASAAAEGLEYLHEKANPPVVLRDLKLSNILLDEDFNPKLSDYGLAKLAQGDTKMHMTPMVMGSNGYCAPEYESHSEFTTKSDIYSFGVILLELITGRKALDAERPTEEQSLVSWAKPFFRDPKRFPEMADPLLKREFPERSLNQAVGIAAMCLQDEPSVRPLIGDLVSLLGFLAVAPPEEPIPPTLSTPNPPSEAKSSGEGEGEDEDDCDHSDSSDDDDGESKHMSDSDYESGSSDGSDHDDGSNAENEDEDGQHQLHQKSQKMRRKSSSSKRKDKMGKRDSNKLSRKSSHKIKEEGIERSTSIASSSCSE